MCEGHKRIEGGGNGAEHTVEGGGVTWLHDVCLLAFGMQNVLNRIIQFCTFIKR